jgi:uncharacterized protein YgiM (DUF1202 family)
MKKTPMLILVFGLVMLLACSLSGTPLDTQAQTSPRPASNPSKLETEAVFLPDPSPTPSTCFVTAKALHLRDCAGPECTVKDWIKEGEQLTILGSNNGWYQVKTQANQSGWVNSKYCGGKP